MCVCVCIAGVVAIVGTAVGRITEFDGDAFVVSDAILLLNATASFLCKPASFSFLKSNGILLMIRLGNDPPVSSDCGDDNVDEGIGILLFLAWPCPEVGIVVGDLKHCFFASSIFYLKPSLQSNYAAN